MKNYIKNTAAILTITLACLTGCKHKKEPVSVTQAPALQTKKADHTWYYFTTSGFIKTDKPETAPSKPKQPWTESLHITSANCSGGQETAAFALVNRLGILSFNNEEVTLTQDVNLFENRTAENLIFYNNVPLFGVYKSSFFNDSVTDPLYKNEKEHLFLLQFDPVSKLAFPLINCNNLSDQPNSEVTDFLWDGKTFYCCVKTISDVKNSFSYLSFENTEPLLSISPSTAKTSLVITELSQDSFRAVKDFKDYSAAPERIKKLLSGFSAEVPFYVEVKTAGGKSPRKYLNKVQKTGNAELKAKAILAQTWSAALFEDGTLFIEGALNGKHVLRNSKNVALRLPKLPAGYIYTDFVISGTTLYAAWEESEFFTTGKSGFLKVDLDQVLYSKLL